MVQTISEATLPMNQRQPLTPADRLAAVGRAIYGEYWIKPFAADLDINRETIRRWMTGYTPLHEDHRVFVDALLLLNRRLDTLTKIRDSLSKMVASIHGVDS
jgi:hypothetical protein